MYSLKTQAIRVAVAVALSAGVVAGAQTFGAVSQSAVSSFNLPRVPAHADLSATVQINGHLPSWARAENASGAVASNEILHLDFVLARSPEVEAAFQQRLRDQQNRTSPFYHQWLTPAQIGSMYGPNQADLDQVTGWLKGQGFQVENVAPSRVFVRASAPSDIVAASLGTSFEMYTLSNGKRYRAALSEPSIPKAFSSLVTAVAGLSETPDEPNSRMHAGTVSANGDAAPEFTTSGGNHYVTPGDFAVIYDVSPLYTAKIDGTGQKIAIIGRSQVNPADITNYENLTGLSTTKQANVVIPPLGADPGLTGDQGEATLDVQRVIGTAPGAQADLVISSSASGGLRTAIAYNVQTLLDPIMTISFGACEASAGQANVNLYTQLFSQSAAEGISVFVSAGDSGAAGCDTHGAGAPSTTQIASINYICSSGFATCVGGTQFNDTASPTNYWATTNATGRVSAKSYIPEGVWNEPTSTSTTTPYVIDAGGGGVSVYTTKPDFQKISGVPADGFRDTPDVSFSSSGHDGYFGCFAQSDGSGSCVVSSSGSYGFEYFSGTSAAAPSMAGIAALLNQKLGSSQGNLNPLIYGLAVTTPAAFNDATVASSGVNGCMVSVPSICNNSTPTASSLTGGLAGYMLTTGYDLATGWGSLDVNKFISAAAGTLTPTTLALTGTSGNVAGTQQLNFTATVTAGGAGTPTGTVQFFANGNPLGSAVAVTTTAGVTTAKYSATNTLANGSYVITAGYSGDSTFDASTSTALNLTITPGGTATSKITLTATPTTTTTSQAVTFSYVVSGSGSSAPTPTGTVTLSTYVGGYDSAITTNTLSSGSGSTQVVFGAGNYVLRVSYSGDSTYLPSTSSTVSVTSNPSQSATVLTGPVNVANGGTATLVANVTGLSPLTTTAGVRFYDGTTLLSTVALSKAANATTGTAPYTTAALSAGTHSFTANFAGDANVLASTSSGLSVVVAPPPGVTLSMASPSVSFAAGASTGNSDVLTVTSVGGFSGSVNVTCSIVYNGTATQTSAPTCTLSSSAVTVAAAGTATTTVTVSTTATHTASNVSPFDRMKWTGGTVAFALMFGWFPFGLVRRRRWQKGSVLAALLLSAGMMAMMGCGGNSSSSSTPQPTTVAGTTTGAYTVTMNATSSTVSSQTTFTINVQ